MYLNFVNTPTRSAIAWRGVSNTLLGLILLMWPLATIYVVVLLFAINLIAVGLQSIFEPLFNKSSSHSLFATIVGILNVVLGLYLIIKPEFSAVVITVFIALWAILFGVYDLIVALKARNLKIDFGWLFGLTGLLSLLFGIYLIFFPAQVILSIIWLVGLYATITGIIFILSSLLMKIPIKGVKNEKK